MPVFFDIDRASYLISAGDIADFLTARGRIGARVTLHGQTDLRIKALLPVHLFGQCCAMNELTDLARQYYLSIVEDVAQACGARMIVGGANKFTGAIGDLGCFSFFPSKNLGGFGDGGMVSANGPALADRIRMLRRHGERTKYNHESNQPQFPPRFAPGRSARNQTAIPGNLVRRANSTRRNVPPTIQPQRAGG